MSPCRSGPASPSSGGRCPRPGPACGSSRRPPRPVLRDLQLERGDLLVRGGHGRVLRRRRRRTSRRRRRRGCPRRSRRGRRSASSSSSCSRGDSGGLDVGEDGELDDVLGADLRDGALTGAARSSGRARAGGGRAGGRRTSCEYVVPVISGRSRARRGSGAAGGVVASASSGRSGSGRRATRRSAAPARPRAAGGPRRCGSSAPGRGR